MKKHSQQVGWFVLSVLFMAFCWRAYAADKVLHLEVVNKTTNDFQYVYVVSGKSECGFGVLGSGHSATVLDFSRPMQTNAFVQFESQGKKHKFEVSLVGAYSSEKRDGTLIFAIHSTNAVVSFEPDED